MGKIRWSWIFVPSAIALLAPAAAQEMSPEEIRARIDAQIEARRQAAEKAGPEGSAERSLWINNSQDYNKPLYGAGPAPSASGGASAAAPRPQPQPPEAALEFNSIQFRVNSDRLSPSSLLTIGGIAEALRRPEYRGRVFAIIGHTDAGGSDAFNLTLSQRRAMSVASALTRAAVPADRLTTVGMGENALKAGLAPTDPANRRVEIVVAK